MANVTVTRADGTTETIALTDTKTDGYDYFGFKCSDGVTRYALLGESTDANASHLWVQKDGTKKYCMLSPETDSGFDVYTTTITTAEEPEGIDIFSPTVQLGDTILYFASDISGTAEKQEEWPDLSGLSTVQTYDNTIAVAKNYPIFAISHSLQIGSKQLPLRSLHIDDPDCENLEVISEASLSFSTSSPAWQITSWLVSATPSNDMLDQKSGTVQLNLMYMIPYSNSLSAWFNLDSTSIAGLPNATYINQHFDNANNKYTFSQFKIGGVIVTDKNTALYIVMPADVTDTSTLPQKTAMAVYDTEGICVAESTEIEIEWPTPNGSAQEALVEISEWKYGTPVDRSNPCFVCFWFPDYFSAEK